MTHKAYSLIEIKSVDGEQRVIRGIATSPALDRTLDIVDPFGVKVADNIPLFLYHDSTKTVGRASFGTATKKGIPFEARIPIITEPGALKDRVDEAWGMVKHGLISAVSIGFRVLDNAYESIKGGGYKYLSTEVLELSLVPVPAQPDAVIQGWKSMSEDAQRDAILTKIKSIDTELLAASGREQRRAVRLDPSPGVSGTTKQPAKSGFFYARTEGNQVKTYAEQLAALKANLEAKSALMEAIHTKVQEEGRTKDAAESEEFAGFARDIEGLQTEMKDVELMERLNIAKAAPVTPAAGQRTPVSVKNTQKLEPGIALARYARCLLLAEGSKHGAAQIAKNQYPEMDWMVGMLDAEVGGLKKEQMFQTKAAVAGGNTTDATWAAPLVQYQMYAQEFVEFLRPQMIVGKFGTGGIPSLRRVPFNVTIGGMTSGASAGWVGEAAPKPVTKAGFTNVNLRWAKIAGITVISDELARMSTPGAEGLLRDEMARAVIERADIDFIDPDKAAVTNVSPASIVNGVSPVASTGGNSAAEVRADIRALFGAWISGNVNPANAVFIMSPGTALAISLMYNDLDSARVFPGLTMNGGSLEGIPVIVSQYAANDGGSAGSLVILANASDIFLSEDAGVDIAVSREASIQMNDAPDNPATASTVFTSMFQTNQMAIRSELFINWAKRRTNAVAWMDSVSWGT